MSRWLKLFLLTTVFVDTRLWKTKHPRKRLQIFRQSYVLSQDREASFSLGVIDISDRNSPITACDFYS